MSILKQGVGSCTITSSYLLVLGDKRDPGHHATIHCFPVIIILVLYVLEYQDIKINSPSGFTQPSRKG